MSALLLMLSTLTPAKADVVEPMRTAIQAHVADRTGRSLDDVEVAEVMFDAPPTPAVRASASRWTQTLASALGGRHSSVYASARCSSSVVASVSRHA